MGLTTDEQMAYGLLAILGRDNAFKERFDKLVKRREEAEAAEAKIGAEREKLEKVQVDTNLHVARKTEELNTAQAKHDASAEEAGRRLHLLQETSTALDKREAALAEREKVLAKKEKDFDYHWATIATREEQVKAREAEIEGLKASLEAKHKALREAIA
jgi:uncharacterized protein (DUF3084 family)